MRINTKNRASEAIIIIIVVGLCLCLSVFLATDLNRPERYQLLWLIPLMYAVCLLLGYLFSDFPHNLAVKCVYIGYGMRFVFVPFMMLLGNYTTLGNESIYGPYVSDAVLLASYEIFVVTLFVIFYSKKHAGLSPNPEINCLTAYSLSKRAKRIILLMVLFVVGILAVTPNLLREAFFLTIGRSEASELLHYSGQVDYYPLGISALKPLTTVSMTVFKVLQCILPVYIITRIKRKTQNKHIQISLIYLVIILTALICTEERAHSIDCALALLVTVNLTFEDDIKINIKTIGIAILAVVVLGLLSKSNITGGIIGNYNELSRTSAAYFNGLNNIATAIAVKETNTSIGIQNLIPDILLHIPYLANKVFANMFGDTINTIFNYSFSARGLGQIIPSISMGSIYFGYVLSPVVPCVAVFFSMFFYRKSLLANDILRRNLFNLGMIMMCRATTISNMLSGVNYLTHLLIAFFFISLIIKRGITDNKKELEHEQDKECNN